MTNTITTIRCSALPLATICPGSVRIPEVQIDTVNEDADVGTVAHFALAKLVKGAHLAKLGFATTPGEAIDVALERFPSVDAEDVRPLFWAGVRAWNEIREWFDEPQAETDFSSGHLSGHVDVCDGKSKRATVALVDWKSGRIDNNYREQLFGYAWLLMQEDRAINSISASAVWLRTGEVESYTVSRGRADEWYRDMVATVINWDGIFRPGDHCAHCPRNHDCPAQTALVRRDVAMFSDGTTADLQTMPGADLVQLHRKLKGLSSRAEEALKAMRAEVERRGGDVDAGDGTHLHFVETNGPRVVDALRAWPVLQSRLTDAELGPAVKVSLSKVEAAVGAKAGKGKAAAAKRALAEELENAGAVSQPTIQKLIDERKKG